MITTPQSLLCSIGFRAVLYLLTLVNAAAAQSAMELNRSGQWPEAADVGLRVATDMDAPLAERCEAYSSVIYAEIRLRRTADAVEHLAAFDRICADAASGTWVEVEVSRLRAELEPVTPSTDDDWAVVEDPAELGLDVGALTEHRSLCERSAADACLVVYNGRIVQEWYGRGYREPMYAMSATKSVTSVLVGLLIADGKLALEDPVSRYIPEWQAGVRMQSRPQPGAEPYEPTAFGLFERLEPRPRF